MIPNQWYILMESRQIKARPVGVTRMGEKMVFWRDDKGTVSCLRDRCAHRGVQLSTGKVLDNGRLQCPFHGFEYDTSGKITHIPANGKDAPVSERFRVHGYPTYEAHGFVWVWWGENPPRDLEHPRFFDDIGDEDGFTSASVSDPWDAHYSRVIENQLDVVHLPFVHYNTIGRGGRTLVDGPPIQWLDADRFRVYARNRVDDGRPPLKPQEVKGDLSERGFWLEFVFPNWWQNHISEDVRVVAAFVPVDEAHTLLYLRFYQKFMQVPLLSQAISRLAMPFNRMVAHQDRRVVNTQQPKPSALRMDEQLIQGDRPIVEYRRRRQELIDATHLSPENK